MPTIQTYELCAESITAHLVHVLARAFGINDQTVRAWRQPKESDANPTGTGKHNPLDQTERVIRVVHHYNPGSARQMAQYFVDLVDELDRASGLSTQESAGGVEEMFEKLRDTIREGADVQIVLAHAHLDEHSLQRARKEIAEEIAALNRLDAAVRARMEKKEAAAAD